METPPIPVLDREALRIAELKNANVLAADMYVIMLPKLTPRGPEALFLLTLIAKSAQTASLRI